MLASTERRGVQHRTKCRFEVANYLRQALQCNVAVSWLREVLQKDLHKL